MPKIKMLKSWHGYQPDDVAEVTDGQAANLIEQGWAVACDEPKPATKPVLTEDDLPPPPAKKRTRRSKPHIDESTTDDASDS